MGPKPGRDSSGSGGATGVELTGFSTGDSAAGDLTGGSVGGTIGGTTGGSGGGVGADRLVRAGEDEGLENLGSEGADGGLRTAGG